MALLRKLTEVDKRRPRKPLDSRTMPHSRVSNLSAGRIVLGYAVIAILWIGFSDAVVTYFKLHPAVMTIKGTVFVFVTASLLYFTIRRLVRAVQLTSQERDETAKLYRTVVEASNEGICLLDESKRISFLNGRLAAMLGRPAEELQGNRLQDFIEEPHVLVQRGAQQSETYECRLRKDSDRKPWVLMSRHPVLNDAGEVVQLVCTAIDITERKRAEEALRERADLLNLTHDTVFVMDMKGVIKYWNRGAEEQYGWNGEQAVGKVVHDMLNTVFPSPLEEIKAEVTRTGRWEGELLHTKKDGTQLVVASRWALQRDEQGSPLAILETNNDISDRLRAEEQRETLRQLEAELAHINRVSMMGELAASIAHEVNQPLSGIVSTGGACLRWLAGDPPNVEEAREAVRDIVRDGKRAGEVIARIRALTKRTAPPKEVLDVNETIREVLAIVGDEAKRKGVVIRTQFADDLSPVSGDRVQLQQVLLNLVMNAMEAMSGVGERARQLVITTRSIDEDRVQVTVEDSGIGLDPNTMARIFEPFYTTKSGGMGMGLSISRSILQNHGGRLWATANEGTGASFHFTLPKYQGEEQNAKVAGV